MKIRVLQHRMHISTQVHFNLEQECSYQMLPSLSLENVVAITRFHGSHLDDYFFEA
jgi:hypothetical protein